MLSAPVIRHGMPVSVESVCLRANLYARVIVRSLDCVRGLTIIVHC